MLVVLNYERSTQKSQQGESKKTPSSLTFQWDAPDYDVKNISGYNIYIRNREAKSLRIINVLGGTNTQAIINELESGKVYFLSVAAVDIWNREGAHSYELAVIMPTTMSKTNATFKIH